MAGFGLQLCPKATSSAKGLFIDGSRAMNDFNAVILEGNMVRDAEVCTTAKGARVCTFSIASNRYFKREGEERYENEVSFIDVETWGNVADRCGKHGHKGRGIRIIGMIKQIRWNDTQGKARSKLLVKADHVEFKPVASKAKAEYSGQETASNIEF